MPVKNQLTIADFTLYRAFYCGICKATGKMYGQLPRFTTNYDIVFLSLLLTDYKQQEVTFENKGCVCNPFKKKTSVCNNDFLEKIVATNIILSYFKASDDVLDDGAKKRFARIMLKRAYVLAKAKMPKIDQIVTTQYDRLRKMESENVCGVDRVSDCFSVMLMEVAREILGECDDQKLLRLCYNIGKFVYLVDALDDTTEDYKKKRYNPLITQFGNFVNRQQFITDNQTDLRFMFSACVNRAIECFNGMVFTGANDLLANVVRVGLRSKVDEIFASDKKLPKPKI